MGKSKKKTPDEVDLHLRASVNVRPMFVVTCGMKQCTNGIATFRIITAFDDEATANSVVENHINMHRDHEKHVAAMLEKIRSRSGDATGVAVSGSEGLGADGGGHPGTTTPDGPATEAGAVSTDA